MFNFNVITFFLFATFGLTPGEYKKVKGLKRQNLRDHMNDLELIFTMLGEAIGKKKWGKSSLQRELSY